MQRGAFKVGFQPIVDNLGVADTQMALSCPVSASCFPRNLASKRDNDSITLANDFAGLGGTVERGRAHNREGDSSEVLAAAAHALSLPLRESRNE